MAKKDEQQATKELFSWDSEEVIGQYGDGKERHTVKIAKLKGKTYVVDTKLVEKKATGWTPVKNYTMPLENFESLADIVSGWKLKDAFASEGGGISISVGEPEGKPKTKRTRKAK